MTITDDMVEMKPCPFCGKEPMSRMVSAAPALWKISCKYCDASPHACFGEEAAIKQWNTRAALEGSVVVPAEVREIVELYFAPWGAAKGARWEALSGDQPFNAEIAMSLIEAAMTRQKAAQPGGFPYCCLDDKFKCPDPDGCALSGCEKAPAVPRQERGAGS